MINIPIPFFDITIKRGSLLSSFRFFNHVTVGIGYPAVLHNNVTTEVPASTTISGSANDVTVNGSTNH